MEEDYTREFLDRALRERLERPENLAELLHDTIPDVAAKLDFSQMRPAPKEFLLGNFRDRESDILFEIPYRADPQPATTLICVMVEHQSRSDWQIPLKTFIYAAAYWEWLWREWEKQPAPKAALRLVPLIPVVLFTGQRAWGSARNFRELFDVPAGLVRYIPDWQPLFWELAQHTTDQLLQQPAPFLQTLAILKAEGSELPVATQLFATLIGQVEPLHDADHSRWQEALKFLLGWAQNRRPQEERPQWHEFALQLQASAERQREIDAMGKTIAQSYIEEGEQRGEARGIAIGAIRTLKRMLLQLASQKFGPPDATTSADLDAIQEPERIERLTLRINAAASWEELLGDA